MYEIVRSIAMLCKYWLADGIETISIPIGDDTEKEKTGDLSLIENLKEEEETPSVKLVALYKSIETCKKCHLAKTRTNLVFGDGNPQSRLVFVGEGPGNEEDLQGLPFVGQAGRLLTKMIQSIGLRREDVYICNVVKCRPPNNRTPSPTEIAACSPLLFKQLQIIKPAVICTLGSCATSTILSSKQPISALRGKVLYWNNIKVIPTFHPAYLLRNASEKSKAWEDFLLIREKLKQT